MRLVKRQTLSLSLDPGGREEYTSQASTLILDSYESGNPVPPSGSQCFKLCRGSSGRYPQVSEITGLLHPSMLPRIVYVAPVAGLEPAPPTPCYRTYVGFS